MAKLYKCDRCEIEFSGMRKNKRNKHFYCSARCAAESVRKVKARPSTEFILGLLEGGESYIAIGKMYSVSDNAVRKWLRSAGVEPPKMQQASESVICSQCGTKIRKEYNQTIDKHGERKEQMFCNVDCQNQWQRETGPLADLTPEVYHDLVSQGHSYRSMGRIYGVAHTTIMKRAKQFNQPVS